MTDDDDLFDLLIRAIEEGDSDLSLTLARKLEPRAANPEDILIIAAGYIDGGDPTRALKLLGNLDGIPLEPQNEMQYWMMVGEVNYILGNPEEALVVFSRVSPINSSDEADLHWWRGLCHDHIGDRARAELCFQKGTETDPGLPSPAIISEKEAFELVGEVIAELPDAIRKELDEVPVVIEDLPPLEVIRSSLGEVHPDILGLYTGQSLQERSWLDAGWAPSSIHIFRRNLERATLDEDQLREEIRITLLHELGHHFGLDEEDLDQLGLA
ncbi:MAG TPA: hypothetical protein EYN79_07710 [Planctomycetes bacterium]|nr:hypothetical protein [Planctomycetota bacterium]HIN79913.1 hypothetical protein [Planctomycetota bacterium]